MANSLEVKLVNKVTCGHLLLNNPDLSKYISINTEANYFSSLKSIKNTEQCKSPDISINTDNFQTT